MTPSTPATNTATGRPATDPAGPTGRLATWVAKTALDDVPASVRDRAKHLTLDGIGCALVGAQLPWSGKAVELVCAIEGGDHATLIGRGLRINAPAAALLNGTFIQGFELDDFHPLAPLHAASVVLPSLFATAELLGGATGADSLLAATCGYEVGPRGGL